MSRRDPVAEQKARSKRVRECSCKHYRGTIEPICAAGVNLREHAGGPDFGWATRLPCNPFLGERDPSAVVPCDKMELRTPEEVAAEEEAMAQAVARVVKTLPLVAQIKRNHEGQSARGTSECPCCGGIVAWTHSSVNGHVWMKCSTDGCVAFME